jgi:hypothetical protein
MVSSWTIKVPSHPSASPRLRKHPENLLATLAAFW